MFIAIYFIKYQFLIISSNKLFISKLFCRYFLLYNYRMIKKRDYLKFIITHFFLYILVFLFFKFCSYSLIEINKIIEELDSFIINLIILIIKNLLPFLMTEKVLSPKVFSLKQIFLILISSYIIRTTFNIFAIINNKSNIVLFQILNYNFTHFHSDDYELYTFGIYVIFDFCFLPLMSIIISSFLLSKRKKILISTKK